MKTKVKNAILDYLKESNEKTRLKTNAGNPAANQFVIKYNNNTYFKSYDTIICEIEYGGDIYLDDMWNYSATTTKYLVYFLEQYAPQYDKLNKPKIAKLIENGTIKIKDLNSKEYSEINETNGDILK